ncbi:hypothetical protein [Caldithrix abyssi]|uniref:hypothetical protein n=1 Tax=Caldithrix abyssi TaxID=187145 RepID=UPI0012378394|nr:hypothetical protein [Caldithrix abyssi]
MNQDLPDFWINRIILSAFQNLSLKWDASFHCSKKSRKSRNPENQGSKTIPKAAQPQPKTNHQERKEVTKRTKIFSRKPFCPASTEKGTPGSKRKNRTVSQNVSRKLSKSVLFTPGAVPKVDESKFLYKTYFGVEETR